MAREANWVGREGVREGVLRGGMQGRECKEGVQGEECKGRSAEGLASGVLLDMLPPVMMTLPAPHPRNVIGTWVETRATFERLPKLSLENCFKT